MNLIDLGSLPLITIFQKLNAVDFLSLKSTCKDLYISVIGNELLIGRLYTICYKDRL